MSKQPLENENESTNRLPPHLKTGPQEGKRSVCLILEGDEEEYYFKQLIKIGVFSHNYKIISINAKSASNIPARYQDKLASDSYHIVLIVCDADRKPAGFKTLLTKVEEIVGKQRTERIIFFSRPCIMQIILLHFEEIWLKSPGTATYMSDVERLTGVKGYDKHASQCEAICSQIHRRDWESFIERLKKLSTDKDIMPSSNIALLFEYLSSDATAWIDELNKLADAEEGDA